jgi:hypothetical protein
MTKNAWIRAAIAVGIVVLAACPGLAQQFGEAGGIKLGVLTIYPSLATALRYDSNIYFAPLDKGDQRRLSTPGKESDFILNLVPDLLFDVTAGTFNFRAGYNYYGDLYAGFDDPLKEHARLNASNHTIRMGLDYTAPVGFFIGAKDSFLFQEVFTTSDQYVDYLPGDQKHNDGTISLGYRRPPGDTISLTLSYRNLWDAYDEEEFRIYNRMDHIARAELLMKFFPRTAVVIEGTGQALRNPNTPDFDAMTYAGMAGVVGQITNHIQIKLKGGFAVWDFVAGDDYRNFLASGEFALVWPPATRVAIGYDRSVQDATDTNFRATDDIHLNYQQVFADRFGLQVGGAYLMSYYSRPREREERFLTADLDFTTRVLYWFYIGLGYEFQRKLLEPGKSAEAEVQRHIGMLKFQAKF